MSCIRIIAVLLLKDAFESFHRFLCHYKFSKEPFDYCVCKSFSCTEEASEQIRQERIRENIK